MYRVIKESHGDRITVGIVTDHDEALLMAWEQETEARIGRGDYEVRYYVEEKK